MGGVGGAISGGASKLGNVFTGNNDMVNGTNQTAGQWKQDGLNNADIKQLGTTPSQGTQDARIGIKAAIGGLGGAMRPTPPRQGGGAQMLPLQPQQQPQFASSDYLQQAGQRFNPFYGG